MDGSYMLRMRAYVKPRGLKPREAQLQIAAEGYMLTNMPG
jgi:hypothetical protein